MSMYPKHAIITILPEWEATLDELKREKFYNNTQTEMLRYVIGIGLERVKEEKEVNKKVPSE